MDLYSVDFRPFVERGFLISPWRLETGYDLLASVRAEFHPSTSFVVTSTFRDSGAVKINPYVAELYPEGTPSDTLLLVEWFHGKQWRLQDAMESLYHQCVDLGADGLIEFQVTNATAPSSQAILSAEPGVVEFIHNTLKKGILRKDFLAEPYPILVISGYAIRRTPAR